MLKKYSFNSFLLVLLALSHLALAQESPKQKSRDVLIKESIANLDSNDLHVAAQAAIDLGMYRATEAVPAMLRVLQSSRLLQTTKHVIAKDGHSLSESVSTDVRREIINSLGLIGDKRAVPVLKEYLKQPLTNREVFTGNVAHALYQITGRSYEYKDYDGVQKLYVPSPLTEEEFRKRSRPDLKATEGLTASLRIDANDSSGNYWIGTHPLIIQLTITNLSKHPIEINPSVENFVFSSVPGNGKRTETPSTLIASPEPSAAFVVRIKPQEKFALKWVVERLNNSPLSDGWAGYVNLKCVYTNPHKQKAGAVWRGTQLTSNSVERYYYATIERSVGAASP